jgi:hypothetical protein
MPANVSIEIGFIVYALTPVVSSSVFSVASGAAVRAKQYWKSPFSFVFGKARIPAAKTGKSHPIQPPEYTSPPQQNQPGPLQVCVWPASSIGWHRQTRLTVLIDGACSIETPRANEFARATQDWASPGQTGTSPGLFQGPKSATIPAMKVRAVIKMIEDDGCVLEQAGLK